MRATPWRDLARDELQTAPRRFVIEQDARAGEHAVAFAVIDRDEMAIDLGHAVRAARVERRRLALRRLPHLAEHLAGGGLVKAGPRTDLPDGLQQAGHAQGGELGGQHRLLPAGRHEGHGRQVVDLVGLDLLEHWATEVWSSRSA